MPKQKNLKRKKEIRKVIARLFARNGYHSTSMRGIARELEMNQSSLYHYFDSKEDILFELMSDAMDDAMAIMEKICTEDMPAEDKLKNVLGFYTRYYAGDQDRLNLLVNEMKSLKQSNRQKLAEKQMRYVLLIKSILKDLGDENKLKDIPPTVIAFAFFSMVHYTIKWYRKGGRVGIDELSDLFIEIITRGILKTEKTPAEGLPPFRS